MGRGGEGLGGVKVTGMPVEVARGGEEEMAGGAAGDTVACEGGEGYVGEDDVVSTEVGEEEGT